ncbi:hypothetical protein [Bradyrhizobium sp. NAS96.2]|uniref:hypothetical protein n=1 Tax=Bradyrhizobium sp. NAS96.2 TaxID=1680160 RepID=UPI00143DCF1B|nr:hypothetical protein [Bradyrhizobium sp. NAS96.2]
MRNRHFELLIVLRAARDLLAALRWKLVLRLVKDERTLRCFESFALIEWKN